MGVEVKVESEVELKSTADKFFKRLSTELHHAPAASEKIHSIDVHEGDWETPGSIKLWTYTLDGKTESFKDKIEIDEEKKTVTMVAVEGHVLERYKTYRIEFKVTPKENDGLAVVKITITVEKHNVGDPDPVMERDFAVNVIKDIDAHLQISN